MIIKIKKYMHNPSFCYLALTSKGLTKWVPDRMHLRLMHRAKLGMWPNVDSPKTFTEKMQWLKLNDHNPAYTTMVDKYRAKDLIASRVGTEYVVQSLAVWSDVDDIDVSGLPEKFVLKTNHDCGGVLICTDKDCFDLDGAKVFFRRHLKRNYFYGCREWPYKNVKPVVFAEEFLESEDDNARDEDDNWEGIDEFDFFCFDGEPRLISYCQGDKNDSEKRYNDFYDTEWNLLPLTMGYASSEEAIPAPKQLSEMLELSRKLSEGVPFLRVDLFICKGRVLVGELTFYPWGGFMPFSPAEAEGTLGEMVSLPLRENEE
mgnify:FL=1